MKNTPVAIMLALTGLINGCRTAPPEIYQWRGVSRNGIFPGGTVNLVRYHDGTLQEAGELKVAGGTGHHFSHPVIADGVMYIRRGGALMAYAIGEQATPLNQE